MSKIEDALNKIKLSKNKGLSVVASDEVGSKNSSVTELTVKRAQSIGQVNHKKSVKEISLMKNKKLFQNDELSELNIIYSDMKDKKITDTYRGLRTKVIQKSQGRNISVMLTSCVSDYSTAMTAINLAAAFALDETKTSVLIDCNLREPKLHEKLQLTEPAGLTDFLESEDLNIDSVLQESGIKRLRVISAGSSRESTMEYFTSSNMRELMSNLIARYSDRYLFVDSAPILDSADTRILVDLCDYVLLVVPYGKANKIKIQEAVDTIGSDKLLGVVFADKPAVPRLKALNFSNLD